jgi:alpha-D-ribose 1-methylphosphonate 5-triphosphate synthase subunit PhnG
MKFLGSSTSGVLFLSFVMMGANATTSFSQDNGFEKRKAEHLAEIDQHLQKMQEHRSCVNSATNIDALKKCRDEMHEWRKNERAEHRDNKLGKRGQPGGGPAK